MKFALLPRQRYEVKADAPLTVAARGEKMSEGLSIHHDQAGHQFVTTVNGDRAYLAYMDLGKHCLLYTSRCV